MGVARLFQIICLITLSYSLVLLLLSLWIIGCAPEVQVPIPEIELTLDIADSGSILEIVDVSDPAKPVKVSSTSLPSKPFYGSSITVWKQFVLATTSYGIHFLDAANPSAPRLLWNLPLDTLSGKTAIFKNCALFPTQKGLYVLHLKHPMEPQWVFHAGHKGNLHSPLVDLKIKGNYAYTIDVHRYLHVLDLSQPEEPRLVDSYTVESPSSFLLFRALGEELNLQPAKIDVNPFHDPSSSSRIGFVIRWGLGQPQRELTPDISSQLVDWNNLLQLNPGLIIKAQISPQYLCWVHLYDDDPQLWFLPRRGNRIYPLDVAPAYIKHQYNSGMKRRPKAGNVTDVIRGSMDKGTFHLISQDNWMKTVKISRDEGSRVADFQLSGDLVYILRQGGILFVAELSTTEGLNGVGLIENLAQPSQCLTLDQNFLYILGSKSPPEVESK